MIDLVAKTIIPGQQGTYRHLTARVSALIADSGQMGWTTYVNRARRVGPREHGRQAARSVRDRSGGQASQTTDHPRLRAAGALDPIEANSATHRYDIV
jgi:hypothetical protein